MAKPVSALRATCRLTGINPQTKQRQALGYFLTAADADAYGSNPDRLRRYGRSMEIEFPRNGEYIKLGEIRNGR